MITIDNIKESLNPKYLINTGIMEEKGEKMKITINFSKEYVLFKSDSKGLNDNDCFNPSTVVLNRKADYIIFTIKNNAIHVVVVELKVSDDPREQLELTKYFADYIIDRIKYKFKCNTTQTVIRKLGIFKSKLPLSLKACTKPGKVYNNDLGFVVTQTLNLAYYL